jgi:hypothetical protein
MGRAPPVTTIDQSPSPSNGNLSSVVVTDGTISVDGKPLTLAWKNGS